MRLRLLAFYVGLMCCSAAFADRPGAPIVKLFNEGQWVEIRDLSPISSSRDVRHIWLHRGTLLYNVTRIPNRPAHRDAITYFGLPVRFLVKTEEGKNLIENITQPEHSSFHLTRNVFCPGETSPFVLTGNCNRGSSPIGEGYVFDLSRVDEDLDGMADVSGGQNFYRVEARVTPETAAALKIEPRFSFPLFDTDLEIYEDKGILFRLDRSHPRREIRFIGQVHQPCGSTQSTTLIKSDIQKAYIEAEGTAGFSFWGWLSTSVTIGGSGETQTEEAETLAIKTTTSEGTTLRQWGLIFEYDENNGKSSKQTPFFVEKVVDCQSTAGNAKFGEKVKSVEVGIRNDFTGKNREYEFDENFYKLNNKILQHLDIPVFMSINDSEKQAGIIDRIKSNKGISDHFLATFIFSQLNLSCPKNDRLGCVQINANSSQSN
ncbi:MAG: hypothetical protein ACPGGK_10775 [Pikeienuella sp.]